MSEYRIKKGGREFTATRIDTLQQLAERGLLQPDDPVSVDGAEFLPAADVPELVPVLETAAQVQPPHDDPWRHWSQGRLDAEDSADPEGGVLASFLGQIESGISPASSLPGARSAPGAPPPDGAPARHVVRPEPDPPKDPSGPARAHAWPGTLSAVLSAGGHRSLPAEDHLPSVEPEPLPDDQPEPPESLDEAEAAPPEPAAGPSSTDDDSPDLEPARPALSTGSPGPDPADSPESMPVTFAEWMERREENGHESPLEGFGRYDNGVVVQGSSRREVNAIRVLLIVMVGATLIGVRWLWVKTIAEAAYPPETELIRKPDIAPQVSDNPLRSVDSVASAPDVGLTPEEIAERARESRLRARMGGHVLDFNTPEQLEDALFQELMNRGVPTRKVEVESLHERGTQDNQNRRPTQAHLKIELTGVSANEDEGYDQLMERLTLTWLLIGKYQTLGRITFENVVVRVAPPLPFERRYDGRRLAGYWDGQLTAAELFLEQ